MNFRIPPSRARRLAERHQAIRELLFPCDDRSAENPSLAVFRDAYRKAALARLDKLLAEHYRHTANTRWVSYTREFLNEMEETTVELELTLGNAQKSTHEAKIGDVSAIDDPEKSTLIRSHPSGSSFESSPAPREQTPVVSGNDEGLIRRHVSVGPDLVPHYYGSSPLAKIRKFETKIGKWKELKRARRLRRVRSGPRFRIRRFIMPETQFRTVSPSLARKRRLRLRMGFVTTEQIVRRYVAHPMSARPESTTLRRLSHHPARVARIKSRIFQDRTRKQWLPRKLRMTYLSGVERQRQLEQARRLRPRIKYIHRTFPLIRPLRLAMESTNRPKWAQHLETKRIRSEMIRAWQRIKAVETKSALWEATRASSQYTPFGSSSPPRTLSSQERNALMRDVEAFIQSLPGGNR